jgi:hypothetical protein
MSHGELYRKGKISKAQFDAAEKLKKTNLTFYKTYEKMLRARIRKYGRAYHKMGS